MTDIQADVEDLDYNPIDETTGQALYNIQWLESAPPHAGAWLYMMRRQKGSMAEPEYLCTIADKVVTQAGGATGFVPAKPDSLRREFALSACMPVEGALFGPLTRDQANHFYRFVFALAAVRNVNYFAAGRNLAHVDPTLKPAAEAIFNEHRAALNKAFVP